MSKLIDVCDFQGGSQPPKSEWISEPREGYIRMLQIRDFTQSRNSDIEYVKLSSTTKTCSSDDILIARYGASIGKILTGLSGAYNVAIMKTIPDTNRLSKKYLLYYLLSDTFQSFICNVGSRAAQAGFNKEELSSLNINLPDLSTQSQIAATLDKVTRLIDLCNAILEKLDLLVKARFVEMFGDPILNPKRWKITRIGDVVKEVKYGTSRPAVDGGKYPYLRMNNLTYDGHLDLTDLKRIDIPDNEIEKCIVHKNDVLFNRTNSAELVGKTCVFNELEDMVIAGYIIRIRLKQNMLPFVLSCFMNTDVIKKRLKNMAKGAVNQANINAKELQTIEIYLPPLDLQEQFVNFVEQTEKTKLKIKQVLEKVELLKSTLMQKYFK